MFISLQVLGVLGRGPPSHSFAEAGWSHLEEGTLPLISLDRDPQFSHLCGLLSAAGPVRRVRA